MANFTSIINQQFAINNILKYLPASENHRSNLISKQLNKKAIFEKLIVEISHLIQTGEYGFYTKKISENLSKLRNLIEDNNNRPLTEVSKINFKGDEKDFVYACVINPDQQTPQLAQIIISEKYRQIPLYFLYHRGVNLDNIKITDTEYCYTDLKDTNFKGSTFNNIDFNNADLSMTNFSESTLTNVNFTGANLQFTQFTRAQSTHTSFNSTNLTGSSLYHTNFSSGNFNNANLSKASILSSNLTDARLIQTNLKRAVILSSTLKNAKLSHANLSDSYLCQSDCSNANFSYTNFTNAVLENTNFSYANLSHANLVGADLHGANLSNANLSNANFIGANLSRVNFTGANLTGAKFVGNTFKTLLTFGLMSMAAGGIGSLLGLSALTVLWPATVAAGGAITIACGLYFASRSGLFQRISNSFNTKNEVNLTLKTAHI